MSDSDSGPRRAKRTKQWRVNQAIHLHFTTDMSLAEIAEDLGVSERTARRYVHEPPADEVREQLHQQATQVRLAAFAELKRHLRAAGHRSRTATTAIKVWAGDDGSLQVTDIQDDAGRTVERIPIPADFVLGPDEEARFFARREAREALEMLIDLVGAAEPDQIELSGSVETEASEEQIADLKDDLTDAFGTE